MLILGNRAIQINRFLIIPFFIGGTALYSLLFVLIERFRNSPKLIHFQKGSYYLFLLVLLLNLLLNIDFNLFIDNTDSPFYLLVEASERLKVVNLQLILLLGFLTSVNIATNYLPAQLQNVPSLSSDTNTSKYSTYKKYFAFLSLILLTAIGLVLRLWNLDLLDSYRDEDHHLSSVRLLFDTGAFEYTRAQLVTYTSAFFIWLGGGVSYYDFLYWGRVPSAIMGALTTIPIYLLGRKISKPVAMVSVLLWVISPWAIGIARNIREHSYYIFIILILVLLALAIIEMVLNFDKKQLPKFIAYNLIMGGVLSYAFFIDWLSTLKVSGVILAAVVGAYTVSNIDKVGRLLWKRKILLVLAILALIGLLLPISGSKFLSADKVINYKWADTFFNPNTNTPIQWWKSITRNSYLVYFIVLIGLFVSIIKKHRHYSIYLLTFLFIVLGYHFFFDRYYSPRYISFALPFFTICTAATVVYLFNIIGTIGRKWLRYPLQIALVAILFNIFYLPNTSKAITNPTILDKSFTLETTGEVHNDKKELLRFLEKLPKQELEKQHIITSIYENVLQHELCVDSTKLHKYKYKKTGRFSSVDSIMNKYESGFLILDSHRNGIWRNGYAKERNAIFNVGNAQVQLMQNRKLCQIYQWKTDLLTSKKYDIPATMRHFTDFSIDIGKPFTLSFWVNIPKIADAPLMFIGNIEDNGIVVDAVTDQDNNSKLRFNYGSTMEGYFSQTPPLNDQEWHHVVLHHYGGAKGSPFFIYVDGQKQEPFARVPVHKSKMLEVILSQAFQGDVQDIRIYNKAIKAQQIADIYEKNTADTLAFNSLTPVGTSEAQEKVELVEKEAKTNSNDSLTTAKDAEKTVVDDTKEELVAENIEDNTNNKDDIVVEKEVNNTASNEKKVPISEEKKAELLKAATAFPTSPTTDSTEVTPSLSKAETATTIKEEKPETAQPIEEKMAEPLPKKVENNKTTPEPVVASSSPKETIKESKPKETSKKETPKEKTKLQRHKLYVVQIGAFKNVDHKKLKSLTSVGQLYSEKSGSLTKILVGPYTNSSAAQQAANKIKAKGFAAKQRSITIKYPTITTNINTQELKKIKREPKLSTLRKL